jgi:D-sedoheptulose 7-phosphate isomerase
MPDFVQKVRRRAEETVRTQQAFFETQGESIVACARALDAALSAGGRLFTFGCGGSACDAQHAAVEFAHPVFEKRKPIASFALPSDVAHLTALGNDRDFSVAFADQLRVLARKGDVAFALSTSGKSPSVLRGLGAAREIGMLTIALSGRDGGKLSALCDHLFVVPSFSVHRIQEAHLTLVHVLWDLVHVLRGEEDTVG